MLICMRKEKIMLTVEALPAAGSDPHQASLALMGLRPEAGGRPAGCGQVRAWRHLSRDLAHYRIDGHPAKTGAFATQVFFALIGLRTKEDYLAHRDALRRCLRTLAAHQAYLSAEMRRPGGNPLAQARRAAGAGVVTALIEIRRSGKAWSAERAAGTAGRAA